MSGRVLKAKWTKELADDLWGMHRVGHDVYDIQVPTHLEPGKMFHPVGEADRIYMVISRDQIKEEYIIWSFKDQQEYTITLKIGFSPNVIIVDNLKD